MVVILSQRTNTQKLHKVSYFQFRKNLYQKTEFYEIKYFFIEYSIRYAIGKGEVITRSE